MHRINRTRQPISYEQQVISWYLEEVEEEISKQNKKQGVMRTDWSEINKLKEQAKMVYTPTKEVFALADDKLGLPMLVKEGIHLKHFAWQNGRWVSLHHTVLH